MPITTQKMATNVADVQFTYGTDQINIVYRPGLLTNTILNQLDDGLEEMDAALCQVISSWDVFEDDEQTIMFPLNPERLGELPFDFRVLCGQAIVMDARPELSASQKTGKTKS